MSSGRRLIVTVQKSTFSKSPWDSYVRMFSEKDGRSVEEAFLDWWTELSPKSFTRSRAIVRVWDVDLDQERDDLMAPASLRNLTK